MIPSVCSGSARTVWPEFESHSFTAPSAEMETTWSFGVHCAPQTSSLWPGEAGAAGQKKCSRRDARGAPTFAAVAYVQELQALRVL